MTPAEIHATLLTAFAALTPRQQARLREHARKGTRIACGEKAHLFGIPGGG